MYKHISLILLTSSCVLTSSNTLAQNNSFTNNNQNITNKPAKIKWLGVSLGQISPALQSQLTSQLKGGTGVMIKAVQQNSPAEKAGLQAFDIVTHIDKKPVSSSQQVYTLVQQSRIGQNIELNYIRAGQKRMATAKISSRDVNNQSFGNQLFPNWPNSNRFGGWPDFNNDPFWNSPPNWNDPFFQNFNRDFNNRFNQGFPSPFFNFPEMPKMPDFPKNFGENLGKNQSGTNIQSFSQSESLSIETLQDGKLHAELKSKDTDGNEKKFVFEGKRDQIIMDIHQQKDLPEAQKQKLIGAIQGSFSSFFNNSFENGLLPQMPRGPFTEPLQKKPPKRLSY